MSVFFLTLFFAVSSTLSSSLARLLFSFPLSSINSSILLYRPSILSSSSPILFLLSSLMLDLKELEVSIFFFHNNGLCPPQTMLPQRFNWFSRYRKRKNRQSSNSSSALTCSRQIEEEKKDNYIPDHQLGNQER